MVIGAAGVHGVHVLRVMEKVMVQAHVHVSVTTHHLQTEVNPVQPIKTMTCKKRTALVELTSAYLRLTVCSTFNHAMDGILEDGQFNLEKHQVMALARPLTRQALS